jgi:hypothetical protein
MVHDSWQLTHLPICVILPVLCVRVIDEPGRFQ